MRESLRGIALANDQGLCRFNVNWGQSVPLTGGLLASQLVVPPNRCPEVGIDSFCKTVACHKSNHQRTWEVHALVCFDQSFDCSARRRAHQSCRYTRKSFRTEGTLP